MNEIASVNQSRQRRAHSRNRTGCTTCRRRHVRCDETKPTCLKCLVRGHDCKYPDLEIWRTNENKGAARPAFVGRQRWFAVWQLHRNPGGCFDPFDCLPTGMPVLSHKLFQYFMQVHENECQLPLSKDSIGHLLQDPNSIRNVLLLAGLHHFWNIGGLREYEATFITHKIESIRVINSLIENFNLNPNNVGECVHCIATLCLMETTIGNLAAAETHLDGLITLMESANARLCSTDDGPRRKNVALNRYVFFCIQDVMRTKLQHKAIALEQAAWERGSSQSVYQMTNYPKTGGILRTVSQFGDRLVTLWMIAYFISARGNILSHDINAPSFFYYLRALTDVHVGCHPCQSFDLMCTSADDDLYSKLDNSTTFYLWGLSEDGAMVQLTNAPSEAQGCSWIGISVATGFYIYGILTGGMALEAIQGRPLLWSIMLLMEDIEEDEAAMVTGARSRSLWFWRVFLGAIGVGNASNLADRTESGNITRYKALRAWFAKRIRLWSTVTGVTCWEKAKCALAACVWPARTTMESLAIHIWEEAIEK